MTGGPPNVFRVRAASNYRNKQVSHPEVLKLLESNAEWAHQVRCEKPTFFRSLSMSQEPPFFFIGCSDSRVPPERTMNLEPGQLFVLRNIANQVLPGDLSAQSALDYAVNHLKVRHVIVCGHTNCGGVAAAMMRRGGAQQLEQSLKMWLSGVAELVERHASQLQALPEHQRAGRLSELNALRQMRVLADSDVVQDAWAEGRFLHLHAWMYDVTTGQFKELAALQGQAENHATPKTELSQF